LKIPNAALRFKPPEPPTNQAFTARMLARIGLGKENKKTATNTVTAAARSGTNKVAAAESSPPPLTGNEPPEELMRRLREMRERGEEPSPELRAKLRELFQSGALQRPAGGGGGMGGGAGARPRPAQPSSRTIYVLATNAPAGGGEVVPAPQPLRVKTGISDGAYTEITDGLKDGDSVITSVKLPQVQTATTAPQGTSPFGGGGGRRGF
jgi:hypothetical protein